MRETARPLEGLRIILVDDDRENLDAIATLLEMNGAEVRRCGTVAHAREEWTLFRPQLLISDLVMPGENGFDLILGIRQLPPEEGGEVPAIAFSASADSVMRQRALACGFQAFVSKLDIPLLLPAILAWTPRGLG